MPYPRFNSLDVVWDLPDNCQEWDHVETTLYRLENHLVSLSFAGKFVFFVTCEANKLEVKAHVPIVVYQIKDKAHQIPSYTNNAFVIFKN